MTINLTLPTSWNSCTPSQLEAICLAQQQAQMLPADQQSMAWKTNCFLALAGLEIEEANLTDEQGNHYILACASRFPREDTHHAHTTHSSQLSIINSQLSIPIYSYQVHYWIKEYLQWLDAIPNITHFPYPEWKSGGVTFRGPGIQLNNWTWQQYRLLKDYLDYFFKMEERLANSPYQPHSPHNSQLSIINSQLTNAMSMVLATLYNREVNYLDETSHLPTHGYHYHPNQSTDNSKYFHNFPPIRFAVILLWWTSIATQLQKKYPKCFGSPDKPDKKKKRKPKPQDPIAEYARTTATLEKYMGVNEQELQQESYTVVLQHLQDMIKQNEEVERMNAKMKSKK